jgi:hypothetical protein
MQRTAEAPPQAALTQRTTEVPPQAVPTRCATPYSRIWRPLAAALVCGSWAFTGGLACHGGPHVGPHTLTACWRKPYRGRRGRRSSRGREQLAQGQRGRGACPHPKVFKEPGTRAPWVRPTAPPAAPSGQRAADVGRYGESSRAGPSVIGKLVCHVKTSPALASKPRGARYLDRGTSRWNSRAPARQGPSPEERHPVYPQRFNWFESTPRNAPRLPIQTNNHTTSEPHTHVMSNENKFPLKNTSRRSGPRVALALCV